MACVVSNRAGSQPITLLLRELGKFKASFAHGSSTRRRNDAPAASDAGCRTVFAPELIVVNEAKRASAHRLKPFGDSTKVFQDSITVHQDDSGR